MSYSKVAQEENWQMMLLHQLVHNMIQKGLDFYLELSANNHYYLFNKLFLRINIIKHQDIELVLPQGVLKLKAVREKKNSQFGLHTIYLWKTPTF